MAGDPRFDEAPPPTEREKVEGWRFHCLREAGYPLDYAEQLAHSEADLHKAVLLLRGGRRTPETALRILL